MAETSLICGMFCSAASFGTNAKEVEAFAFPLLLPEKLRKARAAIGETPIPYLESTLDSSLPVLPLMGTEFEMEAVERSRWRRAPVHPNLLRAMVAA